MIKERPYVGSAIINGKVRFTSVSAIKMFDKATDGGCHRKYAFVYKFKKRLARTKSQTGGVNYAETFQHYLETGEDVLPKVLQPVKKYVPLPGSDLECERPLGDLEKAVALRDVLLAQPPGVWPNLLISEINKHAGLTAAGIPVDGAADVRHRRGEYIDCNGLLKPEPVGAVVVQIGDLKTTSRIYPHKILKGQNAGQIIPAYTKTDAEVCEDTQMVGYARHAMNKYPDMTHARLLHFYANTTKREATVRGGIIPVERILERWDRVEGVVREMEQVATAERIEDVEPNTLACDSYTHVDPTDDQLNPKKPPLKGCGHRYYCPLAITQVVNTMLGSYKESAMSLFDQIPGAPVAPAPVAAPLPPPLDDVSHAAAVAAHKAKLMADMDADEEEEEDAATVLTVYQLAQRGLLRDAGNGQAYVKEGAAEGFLLKPMTPEWRQAIDAFNQTQAPVPPTPPAPPQSPYAVAPPDQPRTTDLLKAAAPVPPEEIAQIEDPALKAKVEEHARQSAVNAAAEAAREEAEKVAAGTSVWCPGGAQKIVINTEQAVDGYTCACTKHWTIKALKPLKEDGRHVAVIPRHKPVNKQVAEPPAPPAPSLAVAPPPPPPPVVIAPPPPPAPPVVEALFDLGKQLDAVQPSAGMVANGHTNGHIHTAVPTHRPGVVVFRILTGDGKFFSVLAATIEIAIAMMGQYTSAPVRSIEMLVGDVVGG